MGLASGADDGRRSATVGERLVYDLTQPLGPRSPRSSDHPQARFESLRGRLRHGVRTSTLNTSVHVGTHVDSPDLLALSLMLDGVEAAQARVVALV